MKRMTKILTNSSDKNKPAISSSASATSLPRKSDEAPHLDLNLTTENSFGGGIRAAAAAAGRDSPAPAPASGAPTNLASIPEARQQAYFDLPTMASTPNLPIYSTMPRTPMALSPHATGQTTMMSQPADMQSIGQMGAVQYLANPAQPKTSPSRPQSNRASPSQDAVTSAAAAAASPVERADLHKSLKSLEVLLVQLDEYRELQSTLAKVEKKLFKSCAELAKNNKGVIASAPASALQHSAAIFEAQHEVSSKHAKMVQKEYEALNEACAKYFKKVAKEERTHEDLVQNLEIKVRKVQSTYDGKKAQSGPRALEAHDRYIATMSGLTNDIAKAKSSHAASIGVKSHSTALLVASTVGGLAEASFRAQCETVRRSGPSVGPLASSVNFCASEAMPTNMPLDLTEEEVGMAAHYAVAEAQAAEAQRLAREAALHQVRQQAVSDWKQQHDEQQQQYAALAAQVMHGGQDPSVALSEKHQGSRQQILAAALPRLDSSGREIGDGNGRDFRVGASYYQNEAPNPPKRAGPVVEEDEEEDGQEASKAAATGLRAVSASSAGPSGLQAASSASPGMQRETSVHSRHSQAAEPTFIDHGASKEESMAGAEETEPKPTRDVKSATPSPSPSLQREASQQSQTASLSAGGGSAVGSGSAISSLSSSSPTTAASPYPRTPDEGEALPGAFPPTSSTAALSVPPAVPEESEAAAAAPSPAAASMPRFASPRPIRDSPSPTPTPTPTTKPPTTADTATSSTLSPSPSVKHKWEQERERSLAKQREAELEKRLREAEDRLRLVERANVPASTSSSTLLPPRQPMPHRRDSAPMPVGVGMGAYSSSSGSMMGTRPGMGAPRSVSGTYGMQQQQQDERARPQQRAVSPQPLYRQEAQSSQPPTASSSTDSANSQHQLSSHIHRSPPRDRDHHLTPPYDSRDRRHATPPDERDRHNDLQYHAAQQRQRRRQSSTESERSFVARMKAHYQAEREKNSPSAVSPYRADAAAPAAAGRRGSVSPYDEGRGERGYGAGVGGGGRGNGEKQWRRATMQVPPPASQLQSQSRSEVGEFGEYSNSQRHAPSPYDHQPPPPQQQRRPSGYLDGGGDGYGGGPSSLSVGREAPRHSDICGCQSCSARHYATDSVKARSAAAAMSGGGRGGEMGGRGGDGRGMTTGRVSGGGSAVFGGRR